VLFRVLGWVCGVLFVGVLWVLSCTVLFSLFPFSIKLIITYQKKKKKNYVQCCRVKAKNLAEAVNMVC
jgi:hypothetical protein